jgi:hypothetical protein
LDYRADAGHRYPEVTQEPRSAAFYHEVVLAVRMLIDPLLRGEFALKQRRLGLSCTSYVNRLVITLSQRYRRASTVGE